MRFSSFSSMCTWAGPLGCGARWRFETPLKSSSKCSSQRSCSERTACHPAAPGSLQTGGSVPEGSSAPAPGPVQENNQQCLQFYYLVLNCVVPWWGSPASAATRCGSERGFPVSKCSPAGQPLWTPHPQSSGPFESAPTFWSHSPSAPPGTAETPGNEKLVEKNRNRGMRSEQVPLSLAWLIHQPLHTTLFP